MEIVKQEQLRICFSVEILKAAEQIWFMVSAVNQLLCEGAALQLTSDLSGQVVVMVCLVAALSDSVLSLYPRIFSCRIFQSFLYLFQSKYYPVLSQMWFTNWVKVQTSVLNLWFGL